MVWPVMLSGCPTDTVRCAFDSDCARGRACVKKRCLIKCKDDEACADEVASGAPGAERVECVSTTRDDEVLNVCADPLWIAQDEARQTDCVEDAECVEALGEAEAQCGIHQTCLLPERALGVLVEDVTTSTTLTGSEVLDLRVIDRAGEPLGYARALTYSPQPPETPAAVSLDGSARTWRADLSCLVDATGAGLTLGRGGSVLVDFLQADGQPLRTLPQGAQLAIIVRGAGCGADSAPGEYRALWCVTNTGEPLRSGRGCDQVLVTQQDTATVVALPDGSGATN